MRILIADDNPQVRSAVRQLLSAQADWEVCGEASSGPQTIAKVQELKPDLVLLDVSMPVLDGFATARAIRGENSQTKILIVSHSEVSELLPAALEAGANACLDKAQIGRELIGTIREL